MAERLRTAEPVTVEGFLDFVETRPDMERWELHDGVLVMMTEPVVGHQMIADNLGTALRDRLRDRGCRAIREVAVARSADERTSLVPDLIVRCGPIDPKRRVVIDAIAVVEVISPSTLHYDRGYKFERYREFETIEQIVLVYPDEMRVEVWTREPGGPWQPNWPRVLRAPSDVLEIAPTGAAVTLADIYDGVLA